MSDYIRNIAQTVQERDIIKTAPDMLVYINNLPYLFNPYIGVDGVIVNFNDYVTQISASCDTDTLIPTGTVSLSIPNHYSNLFIAPGGNKIISTMSLIKIFGKGYYFDKDGNTVYKRVFYGIIDSISYTFTINTLEISINCKGIMRLLELIQTNISPSALNYGVLNGINPTAFSSRDYSKNPLAIIRDNVIVPLTPGETTAAFQPPTIQTSGNNSEDSRIPRGELEDAINKRYVSRWGIILEELNKCIRIFGIDYTKDVPIKDGTDALKSYFAYQNDKVLKFLPDYSVGSIQLLTSNITSRLERIRVMSDAAGYEAYQDLNGDIIFKPPLFNLNSTKYSPTNTPNLHNPFIIKLVEVLDEQEQEDENAVRSTRVTVRGLPWGALLQGQATEIVPGAASYTDVNLLSKFGLREEPVKEIVFLGDNTKVNYAFAISEMYKMNRAYRTYRVSIPFRPELKLGFPCYIEHHDMFGYIRNISWNYNVGGTNTMSITMDSIRRRSLMPILISREENGKKIQTYEFKSIPNLVSRFTKNDKVLQDTATPSQKEANPEGTYQARTQTADEKKTDLKRNEAPEDLAYGKNLSFDDYYRFITLEVKSPDLNQTWRITKDTDNKFSVPRACDENYLIDLFEVQPYTDEDGYELYGPLPWGRWMTVEECIQLFTESLDSTNKSNKDLTNPVESYMYSAVGNPIVNALTSKIMRDIEISFANSDITEFTLKTEVDYSKPQDQNFDSAPQSVGVATGGNPTIGSPEYVTKADMIKQKLVMSPKDNSLSYSPDNK